MDSIKRIYRSSLDFVGETPSLRRDWRWLALYAAVIYVLVLALRLSFAGRWDHPELWVNGERILATHDAYFWLAKAKGVGILGGFPLAEFASWVHRSYGISLGAIGFWMPGIMGALVGVVCYLWGWLIGGRYAGLFAGLAGSLTPGFFYRSRLGYFDTDMFTLLMPLMVLGLLAYWVGFHIRTSWFAKGDDEGESLPSLWVVFVLGFVIRAGVRWHEDILNVTIMCWIMAAVILVIVGVRGRRANGLYGLATIALLAFPGESHGRILLSPFSQFHLIGTPSFSTMIWGVICAAGLTFIIWCGLRRNSKWINNAWVALGVCLAVAYSTNMGQVSLIGSLLKLVGYFSQTGAVDVTEKTLAMGPIYPSIIQSIIEAKLVPLSEIFARGAFFPWLGWIALLSAALVCLLRPVSIFLFPLLALHLASVKLGIRFSMFGGAPLMVFLGVGLYWLTRALACRFSVKEGAVVGVQVVLGLSVLGYCFNVYGKLPLTPVIPRAHAEALVELGHLAPEGGTIWTWWDWGYASQYYAGLETVVDGGKHAGRYVYPVAYVMSSPSAEKANRMVAFSAQYPSPSMLELGPSPAVQWDKIPRDQLSASLERDLARTDYPVTSPQYLVVTWKDMNIIKWISYFGNWDLQTGETRQAAAGSFDPGELGINVQRGAVVNRKGGGGLVKDITVLDWNSSQTQSYFMNAMSPQLLPKRHHLLVNAVSRQSVLMDDAGYRSLMRRLLTDDPNDPETSKYFKIVVDNLPFARIYEVIQ